MKPFKPVFNLLQLKQRVFLFAALFSSLFMLSACQFTSDDTSGSETGELVIQLTDAEGDFSTYTVDVLSITLTRQDDAVVEVLPENTRVDFAQYVEMTELLTSATVPTGIYTSATMTLDYSSAEIFAENADGDLIQVTNIVDDNNDPITTLVTNVTLDERNQLAIARGIPAHLSLDFDLKTSNVVNFDDQSAPFVIVSPTLIASLEPDLEKTHRVRGPLKSVDVDDSSFELIIRPFNRPLSDKRAKFGSLKILTNDDTTFEINGESSMGSDGMTAMDALDTLTGVIVVGDISLRPRRFMATEVYAGSSVPGGDKDAVTGTVLSRVDNALTVKGVTLIRSGGSVLFNDEVSVTIDTTTIVTRQNDTNDFSIDDISVGQRITVFGELNEDTANPALDASEGMLRMLITSVAGQVVSELDSAITQPFALDLSSINGRSIDMFDFAGTGTETANDADPMFYEIETSTLNLAPFTLDTMVNIRGFVNSFGQAPADFIAKSIISKPVKLQKAVMHTDWKPASANAFSEMTSEKLTLDLTETGRFHHMGRGHQKVDLKSLDTDFSFVPVAEGEDAVYVVLEQGNRHVHTSFENLVNDLTNLINDGSKIRRIQSKGTFDGTTGNFAASYIKIKIK